MRPEDADTKLVITWAVSRRDAGCAADLLQDVAGRLANRIQLTTDGHRMYLTAVSLGFLGLCPAGSSNFAGALFTLFVCHGLKPALAADIAALGPHLAHNLLDDGKFLGSVASMKTRRAFCTVSSFGVLRARFGISPSAARTGGTVKRSRFQMDPLPSVGASIAYLCRTLRTYSTNPIVFLAFPISKRRVGCYTHSTPIKNARRTEMPNVRARALFGLASLLLCGALQVHASPVLYDMDFTALNFMGPAPTSGSFDYDASAAAGSQFTDFIVVWNGFIVRSHGCCQQPGRP